MLILIVVMVSIEMHKHFVRNLGSPNACGRFRTVLVAGLAVAEWPWSMTTKRNVNHLVCCLDLRFLGATTTKGSIIFAIP